MPATLTWVYANSAASQDNFNIVVTTSATPTTVLGATYYNITNITGTFNGIAITGVDHSAISGNIIYTSSIDIDGYSALDGLGFHGFSALLANGTGFTCGSFAGLLDGTLYNIVTTLGVSVNVGIRALSLAGATFTSPLTACYAEGTRIATALGGAVNVEALLPGDVLVSAFGGTTTVIWTGHRRIACALHPRPWDVMPVRVRAHAFGVGLPERDLVLSPDHAIAWQGVLIPVRYLINDVTILQEQTDRITYWHVECAQHDVLLAEGLPAESYLDTGNRQAFQNAEPAVVDGRGTSSLACLPLVVAGPALDAAREQIADQAKALGTPLPEYHTVRLDHTGTTSAVLPSGTERVHLVSICDIPPGERRRLGAAIEAITLDAGAIALDSPAIVSGFHTIETHGPRSWRWTHGAGFLAIKPVAHPRLLTVSVAMLQTAARAA